jgi:hypothetical protein
MKSRLFAKETPQAQRRREREMKGKREKAALYPWDLSVIFFLCGSVPLWLLMR